GDAPCSYAITLDFALGYWAARSPRVIATDLDTHVLAKADAGVYAFEQVNHRSPERLKRFVLQGTGAQAGRVKVRPE
ncbi:CheR family methyltransferase, partial [Burkholderia pseudomallei]